MEKIKGNIIVMFPFMAQGHMNPFLDLARHLSSLQTSLSSSSSPPFTIKIISTPANILNLRPRFISYYPTIDFIEISLPPSSSSSSSSSSENTDTLASHSAISQFYESSESLRPSFHHLISEINQSNNGCPPICIISDMFLGFAVDVAHSFGSHHVTFYTSGPYAMSIYNSIWSNLSQLKHHLNHDQQFSLPGFHPNITINRTQITEHMKSAIETENPSSNFTKRQAEYCKKSDGSLWNTVEAIEKSSLEYWARFNTSGDDHGTSTSTKPVWAIGPLLPISSKEFERGGKNPGLSPQICIDWLNRHPPKSVLYVSFGSQNSIPVDQMMELARGLEQSEKGFIWVLRNPTGINVNDEFKSEWLPFGFEDRVVKEKKQGLLVRNWAPQMEILSHESVGGFLSHLGWNSVLESLSRGVPMIGWPLGAEQFYNSKMLEEELGVCVEFARGFNAEIESGDLVKMVRLVLESEKGDEMRRRALSLSEEMKKAVRVGVDGVKGSSVRALDDFVNTVMEWAKDLQLVVPEE